MSAGREAMAAVPGAAPTVFLALELSKASWIVALHTPAATRVSPHRLPAGDAEALLAFAAKARVAAVDATDDAGVAVVSCYEAGYDGFWLHRVLVAAGSPTWSSIPPASRSTAAPGGPRPTASTPRRCCGR